MNAQLVLVICRFEAVLKRTRHHGDLDKVAIESGELIDEACVTRELCSVYVGKTAETKFIKPEAASDG